MQFYSEPANWRSPTYKIGGCQFTFWRAPILEKGGFPKRGVLWVLAIHIVDTDVIADAVCADTVSETQGFCSQLMGQFAARVDSQRCPFEVWTNPELGSPHLVCKITKQQTTITSKHFCAVVAEIIAELIHFEPEVCILSLKSVSVMANTSNSRDNLYLQ